MRTISTLSSQPSLSSAVRTSSARPITTSLGDCEKPLADLFLILGAARSALRSRESPAVTLPCSSSNIPAARYLPRSSRLLPPDGAVLEHQLGVFSPNDSIAISVLPRRLPADSGAAGEGPHKNQAFSEQRHDYDRCWGEEVRHQSSVLCIYQSCISANRRSCTRLGQKRVCLCRWHSVSYRSCRCSTCRGSQSPE